MTKHTLYAYVDGADLQNVEHQIEEGLADKISHGTWRVAAPRLVNQRHSAIGLSPGDLPLWDLGVNLDLPNPGIEPNGWFSDVEAIVSFTAELHKTVGSDFVIGIADTETGVSEDLFFVDSSEPDLAKLREVISISPSE